MRIPAEAGQVVDGAFAFGFDDPGALLGKFQPAARPELAAAFRGGRRRGGASGSHSPGIHASGDRRTPAAISQGAWRRTDDRPHPRRFYGRRRESICRRISALRLTIKSADAQSAEALRTKLAEMMRLAGACKEVRSLLPKFAEAAAVLAPKVEGDRLVLVLNEQNQGVEKLLSLVTPPIEVMRASAARLQSRDNLMEIALAMHNYYSANNHFPCLPVSARTASRC